MFWPKKASLMKISHASTFPRDNSILEIIIPGKLDKNSNNVVIEYFVKIYIYRIITILGKPYQKKLITERVS